VIEQGSTLMLRAFAYVPRRVNRPAELQDWAARRPPSKIKPLGGSRHLG